MVGSGLTGDKSSQVGPPTQPPPPPPEDDVERRLSSVSESSLLIDPESCAAAGDGREACDKFLLLPDLP